LTNFPHKRSPAVASLISEHLRNDAALYQWDFYCLTHMQGRKNRRRESPVPETYADLTVEISDSRPLAHHSGHGGAGTAADRHCYAPERKSADVPASENHQRHASNRRYYFRPDSEVP
jgi:hypothetical protein